MSRQLERAGVCPSGANEWFQAIWLLCRSPEGICAKQVEREIGVHYETAWRIRKAMRHDIFEDQLCGIIEVDGAEVKANDPGGKGRTKAKVAGMAECDGGFRMAIVEDLKKENIRYVIARNLGKVKRICSDGALRYRYLREFAEHRDALHYMTYSDEDVRVAFVENAWSLFKRGLVRMFHTCEREVPPGLPGRVRVPLLSPRGEGQDVQSGSGEL